MGWRHGCESQRLIEEIRQDRKLPTKCVQEEALVLSSPFNVLAEV